MDVIFSSCAGRDGHQRRVRACRITPDATGQQADGVVEVKACPTLTHALLARSDWLAAADLTHVAMESPGADWKPMFNLVERNFQVFLVHATHGQRVPGRKTDQADARWLARLMRDGLLQASFMPPQGQRDVRELTRDRTTLVQERTREVNRVQGGLERGGGFSPALSASRRGRRRDPAPLARHRTDVSSGDRPPGHHSWP